ncbi:MAG: nucleotidyltransferase family protein [Megasphaera sp.]|jgi:molybdenum cofactor cytidylyltransferase|nr:nucleotidyltransferase family protein [Megasphaera sp.]MCH4187351.1 nucleotidyltransferase family protein [Megasphaera sp.]MCH4217533.1 nucleotidyltransferase family protein [Megasphaera sp.]
MDIGLVYMASGQSRRFGSNKLLASLGDRPLYQYGFNALQQAAQLVLPQGIRCTLVVVSPYPVIRNWCSNAGAVVYDNPQAAEGMAASIRKGTAQCMGMQALAFFTADQPLLQGETIAAFLKGFVASEKQIGAMTRAGRLGNPAVFTIRYAEELQALQGDRGGRSLLQAHAQDVWCFAVAAEQLLDVDTAADLASIEQVISQGQHTK